MTLRAIHIVHLVCIVGGSEATLRCLKSLLFLSAGRWQFLSSWFKLLCIKSLCIIKQILHIQTSVLATEVLLFIT